MSSEIAAAKAEAPNRKSARKVKRTSRSGRSKSGANTRGGTAKFPRHTVERALRIARAIIEQNAGKECSETDSAKYVGVGLNGPFRVEISSAIKYGFLTRSRPGFLEVTERARQAIRPQKTGDDVEALRQAILDAPEISEVYLHYRGEDLPDGSFFENALVDKFQIPAEKVQEFIGIFMGSLTSAQLMEKRGENRNLGRHLDAGSRHWVEIEEERGSENSSRR